MFLRDEVEEPVGGRLLAGESDGGENCGPEPWVPTVGKRGAQQLEGFGRVGLGDGHGGFGGSIVLGCKKLRGPGEGGGTFQCEHAGIAGPEEFRLVGGELGAKAEEQRGGVAADLYDRADSVDPDGEFLVGKERDEMGENAMAAELAALDKCESACASERSCGIGRAAPNGF